MKGILNVCVCNIVTSMCSALTLLLCVTSTFTTSSLVWIFTQSLLFATLFLFPFLAACLVLINL